MAMTAWAAKFCHQLDLLVGERADLLAVDGDCADQLVVLEHWDEHHGTRAGDAGRVATMPIEAGEIGMLCPADVGDMNHLLVADDARKTVRVADGTPVAPSLVGKGRAAHVERNDCETHLHRSRHQRQTWPRRCASHSPAWLGRPARSSPGELEMTRSTSEVAVCCSSASASSR